MTSLTIDSALSQARATWFQPGGEDMRLDSITWLQAPTVKVPQMIQSIAKNTGIHVRQAIDLARIIEDADGARMSRSKSFASLPLGALDIWSKANVLYRTNLHKPDSSGAAHSKLVNGQYIKNTYKPGLISLFDGDKFLAFTAYYLVFGGMRAVRDVRRCMDWSADKIKEIILVAINASHKTMKNFGRRGLKWLTDHASAGMGFFQMFFSVIQNRSRVLEMAKIAARKAATVAASPSVSGDDEPEDEDAADGEQEVTDNVADRDGRALRAGDPDDDSSPGGHDGPDDGHGHENGDNGDSDARITGDDPPRRVSDDEFLDDPNALDPDPDPDPDDPGTKLKIGRELAYEILRQARKSTKSTTRNQRFHDLMDTVDEKILVNAMQKGLRPTDLAVAERMTNFISFCWQWAERTGVFLESSHRKKNRLDMPAGQIIKQIINAVQVGYWETGDNKPLDNKKIWIDVTRDDRNGRPRVATLTRPISPQLKAEPHDIKGRMIVVNPDHAQLREFFFAHIQDRDKWPRKENTRYFIVRNGEYETITAQRYFHPRGTALSGARSIDDLEDNGHGQTINAGGDAVVFDFPDDDGAAIRMVADQTGADEDVIRRSMDGDDRAREILAHTCRALPEDRKAMIEATFSQGKHEAEIDACTEVHPSCLNQSDRRDLVRMLNLDLGTLEKAFQDDSDSTRTLKRAIKNMPEHLRSQAIRKIHLAARH